MQMIPGEQIAANVQTHTHAARIQFDRLPQTKAFRIQEFCGSARGTCISTPTQSSFLAGERVFAAAPVCTPTAPLFCSAHGSVALPKRRVKTEFTHATSEDPSCCQVPKMLNHIRISGRYQKPPAEGERGRRAQVWAWRTAAAVDQTRKVVCFVCCVWCSNNICVLPPAREGVCDRRSERGVREE